MKDILFQTETDVFSYRVAGILIHDGKVLLQKPRNDDGYAFPGGHVGFGETSIEALIRELKEELGMEVKVLGLRFVGEVFFSWNHKPCHQISLFYEVDFATIPDFLLASSFLMKDSTENEEYSVEFHWVPLSQIDRLPLYPASTKSLLTNFPTEISHFVDFDRGEKDA